MSVKNAKQSDKILRVANRLALFRRDTHEPNYFKSYSDLRSRADISIKRSALYCCDVFYSDYFNIDDLKRESVILLRALVQFVNKTKISDYTVSNKIEGLKITLDLIIDQAENKTSLDNHTGRAKVIRSRYLAAIVGNCYHDKFAKWPAKTPKGRATQVFIGCVDNICEILDPREPRASSNSCKEFLEKLYYLWADKEIPMLKTM